MSTERRLLHRDEVLSGRLHTDRRAAKLHALIEMRVTYIRAESRRAVEAYFLRDGEPFVRRFDTGHMESIKLSARSSYRLTAADLERYAPQWGPLLPADAELRAALVHLLARRYPLSWEGTPVTCAALGCADADVRGAYQRSHGRALDEALYPEATPPDRPDLIAAAAALDDDELVLRDAEAAVEWLDLPSGATLFRAGEPGDSLYILISGRLAVSAIGAGDEQMVEDLSRGAFVGEMDVLTGEQRSTTVRTIRDSELVRLPGAALTRLAQRYPQVMLRVNRSMANRLRHYVGESRRPRQTVVTLALVPITAGVSMAEFAPRVVQGLQRVAATAHLDRARVEAQLGGGAADTARGDPDDARVVAWLSEQEAEHAHVVYEADAAPSAWTSRCLRQADRIVLLALADADPAPGAIERQIGAMGAEGRTDLVLLHPAGRQQPAGTRRWLAPRRVHEYHHVRLGDAGHLQRLVRRLTGRAVAVVLGGGGARGYAHIGVLRALEEAGIPVDLIGGASMGALMGAGFAIGRGPAEMADRAAAFSPREHIWDFTLPLVSFFATRKLTAWIREQFQDVQIEDLWQPYFCVSSNLARAELVVHQQGPLWRAVRASLAIPGIFAPVLDRSGDVLVDGGVLNNLPLDVMRERFEVGTLLGVSVSPFQERLDAYRFGASVSGWEMLLSRLWPWATSIRAPWLFHSLHRAMEVRGVQQMRSPALLGLADLIIQPPVEQFRGLDFSTAPRVIEAGYLAAQRDLALLAADIAGGPDTAAAG